MGLQQFERRLERMVEGVFAKAFRGGLQPVEIGRRMTREMDLRRTMAPRGTLAPNSFEVQLAPDDRSRFAPIEGELLDELEAVAHEHANVERYSFVGPVTIKIESDDQLSPGVVLVAAEFVKPEGPPPAALVTPDGGRRELSGKGLTIGRLPDCDLVLADPNVSRYHAEVRPATGTHGPAGSYEVSDMGSTNGTKVNGVALSGARPLSDGDEITVGATTLRFEQG